MPHVKANGLSIYYESHGPDDGEPILLIMGLGAQMSRWSPDMIGKLVDAGHRVIPFDNRDVGLTEKLDAAGAPDIARGGRGHHRRAARRRSPTRSTRWPPTRRACWTRWTSSGRTSSAPRWAG